jgi:protein-tyrosine sulfotransferase
MKKSGSRLGRNNPKISQFGKHPDAANAPPRVRGLRRATQLIRLVYVDLVRRRATVRITQSESISSSSERPIFIVGPYRSGTTLLRYVIDSHSRIACPPESDFLAGLNTLVGPTRASRGLESMGYDEQHVLSKVNEFAEYFFGNYARSRGKPRWADKSPTYVEHLYFIRKVFPNAQFVFIHRNPLDQIHSHTKGGSHSNAFIEAHRLAPDEDVRLPAARYWVASTRMITAFASQDYSSYEITYEDLCNSPHTILANLFDFLEEPWEDSVLDFHKVQHDLGMEAARTRSTQGFVVSSGNYSAWPESIRSECTAIVGAMSDAIGVTARSAAFATRVHQ